MPNRPTRGRAAAELRRYASFSHVRSVLAGALTALTAVVAAQETLCNPCVDGPEMFEHRRSQAPRIQTPSTRAVADELFRKCPADLQPTVQPSPEFPAYGNWELTATIRFFVDTEGRVLAPIVWGAKWTREGEIGKAPPTFKSAIVEAVSKWRFPAQASPCASSITRTFSHGLTDVSSNKR